MPGSLWLPERGGDGQQTQNPDITLADQIHKLYGVGVYRRDGDKRTTIRVVVTLLR